MRRSVARYTYLLIAAILIPACGGGGGGGGGGDRIAPAAVSDLAVSGTTSTTVTLSWTAPGNDGLVGTASSYDIRYSPSAILTNSQFAVATPVLGEPVPLVAGSLQIMTVSGLSPTTTYHFALKTSYAVPNLSSLSNSPSATTGVPAIGLSSAALSFSCTEVSRHT